MKPLLFLALFFMVCVMTSCKKDKKVTTGISSAYVNAGGDQIIFIPTDSIELKGTVTGTIVNYHWFKISGPSSFDITNPNVAVTKVKNLVRGSYQFELTIKDDKNFVVKDTVMITVKANDPPKADAGPDVLIGLSCATTSSVAELVGIHSSDPDNNIASHNWTAINRQLRYVLSDSLSSNAKVKVFAAGEYRFELTVTDAGGLSSKDTVLVNVKGTPGIPMEYDLDMTFTTRYTVGTYNYYDPWENPDSSYYTTTEVQGTDTLLPFGQLQISIYQYADTVALNDSIYNSVMNIMKGDYHFYLSGDWSVINFKKFIRSGGGPFAGTFTVGSSSAQTCIGGINTRLPPLAITGNLDVHRQTITLSIKGKVFF